MFDLHRHDEYSTFDGYGKASELAKLAKELGHTALSTTNHGNTNGLIQTYIACQNEGIKPILGVEGYFLPKHKPETRGYHLILIAKNLKGYGNLNKIQYEGEKQKYYNPIWDFKLLEKYKEGLICTTACVAGYLAKCIINDKRDLALKFLKKLKSIFGEDLYIEVQPYKIDDEGTQEKVNIECLKLAKELKIKCILTSDSHRGRKEDFDTYQKMHEIAGHNLFDIEQTYGERYMPSEEEIVDRFVKMHAKDFGNNKKESIKIAKNMANRMIDNLDEIDSKCENDYLGSLPLDLPKLLDDKKQDTYKILVNKVKAGLKERGKYRKEYVERCKDELEVIKFHGFSDYFLIVADYVNWAKDKGIAVGPGRGSVCNSLVAYALKITDVDSLFFNLDFRRFLRKDKSKFPDIDLDFETSRRQEVIEYLCKKYEGHAARICSYGLYKVDNLINDLAKVCGLNIIDKDIPNEQKKEYKQEIAAIKKHVNKYIDEGILDANGLSDDSESANYNNLYDNIIKHFIKLYKKVRYIGTHAAGVAITGGKLLDYVALKIDKNGNLFTNYDLSDIEVVNVIKFDILGLKTMESINDLRKATGVTVNYDELVNDKKIMEAFRNGNCDGVFQFEKPTARNILNDIECDCFDDVVAASSMNRPGPLSLKMQDVYASNKKDSSKIKDSLYWEYTQESYGTIIYQEQVQQICINLANMTWPEADKVTKFMKSTTGATEQALQAYEKNKKVLEDRFVEGVLDKGLTDDEARKLFDDMICYTFNKGHAVGYSLISIEEMYYKLYYSNEYWYVKLKYAKDTNEYYRFCRKAIADGSVVFLPHVNYSAPKTRLRKMEGENIIQQGLSEIKNVGEKAAAFIEQERKQNGIFKSYDDFYDRCKSRLVTVKVIKELREHGALEFNKKSYLNRVVKFNSSYYNG